MGVREQINEIPYLPALTVFCGELDLEELRASLQNKFGYELFISDNSVDMVRNVINVSHTITIPMIYIFHDIQTMSSNAINALLKITEEPPNQAHFVFTVDSIDNLISTIRSRAVIITVSHKKQEFSKDLEDFCNLVSSNIETVSLTNALKITNRIKLKESDTNKFELIDFLKCMRENYMIQAKSYLYLDEYKTLSSLFDKIEITNMFLYQLLHVKGVKKDSLLDEWIIRIREG